mmetsp:Transcript_11620/g.42491  ORF Transcript_11620/g.42491 Transcript_11620/m.42491 type:complete len:208 (-) Transcript_11620:507-1130(-)
MTNAVAISLALLSFICVPFLGFFCAWDADGSLPSTAPPPIKRAVSCFIRSSTNFASALLFKRPQCTFLSFSERTALSGMPTARAAEPSASDSLAVVSFFPDVPFNDSLPSTPLFGSAGPPGTISMLKCSLIKESISRDEEECKKPVRSSHEYSEKVRLILLALYLCATGLSCTCCGSVIASKAMISAELVLACSTLYRCNSSLPMDP